MVARRLEACALLLEKGDKKLFAYSFAAFDHPDISVLLDVFQCIYLSIKQYDCSTLDTPVEKLLFQFRERSKLGDFPQYVWNLI